MKNIRKCYELLITEVNEYGYPVYVFVPPKSPKLDIEMMFKANILK